MPKELYQLRDGRSVPVPGFAPAKTKPCQSCPDPPGCKDGQNWKCNTDTGECEFCCTPYDASCPFTGHQDCIDAGCSKGGGGKPCQSCPDPPGCKDGQNWKCNTDTGECEFCCTPYDASCPFTGHQDCIDAGCSKGGGTTDCPGTRNCSNQGDCIKGICQCDDGWTGNDCSVPTTGPACPGDGTCSGNGVCSSEGNCACHPNWSGLDCSVYRAADGDKDGGSSGIIIFLSVIAGIVFLVIIGMVVFLFISSRKKAGAAGAPGAPAARRTPRKKETIYY